jgi:hypothetical protein
LLQRLELLESFVGLLLQTLDRLLKLKGVILQQDDPLGQLVLAGRRSEDPGADLVCGSAVCHQAISCAGFSWATGTMPTGVRPPLFDWNCIESFQTR